MKEVKSNFEKFDKQSNDFIEINLSILITFYYNQELCDLKMSGNEDSENTKFLFTFANNNVNSDRSMRWVGITNQKGNIIKEQDRKGLKPFLTLEENHQWAIRTMFLILIMFLGDSDSNRELMPEARLEATLRIRFFDEFINCYMI